MFRSRWAAFTLGTIVALLFLAFFELGFGYLGRSYKGNRGIAPKKPLAALLEKNQSTLPSSFLERKIIQENPAPFIPPFTLPSQHFDHQFYKQDRGLLSADPGRYSVRAVSPDTKEELYRAVYTIGPLGYRVTTANPRALRYAVFLGDSFTFGIGVNDAETMPEAFARATDFHVYNMAFGSYGINALLLRADRQEAKTQVKETQGLVLYIFNSDHVIRLLGGMRYVGSWGTDQPYYRLNEDKKIEHVGSFRSGLPLWSLFSQLLSRSNIVRFFSLDWPSRVNEDDARFFALATAELRRKYLEQLPGAHFVFVISPTEARFTQLLLPELKKLGIDVLDYSAFPLDFYLKGPRRIKLDSHHTPEANRLFGEQLAADIQKNFPSQPKRR